jgi:hypothetical protein
MSDILTVKIGATFSVGGVVSLPPSAWTATVLFTDSRPGGVGTSSLGVSISALTDVGATPSTTEDPTPTTHDYTFSLLLQDTSAWPKPLTPGQVVDLAMVVWFTDAAGNRDAAPPVFVRVNP